MDEQKRVVGVHRLAFLDSLRGLAALYVVVFHVAIASDPRLPVAPWLLPLAAFGITGVHLFFIISGFSLSLTMQRHVDSGAPLLSYYCSRFFRIAPLFYFLLLLSYPRDVVISGQQTDSTLNFILNASFLFNLIPRHQEGIVWASWTVSVEVIYYIAFPFLYSLTLGYKLLVFSISLLVFEGVLLFSHASQPYEYFLFVGYIPLFIAGELAWRVYASLHARPDRGLLGALLIASGLAMLAVGIWLAPPGDMILFRAVAGAGYTALLVGAGLLPLTVLVNKVTRFYGRISYSFYLCHMLAMVGLTPVYSYLSEVAPETAIYPLCVVITVVGTTLLSMATYNFVERPGIDLGKTTFRWLASRRRIAPG